MDEAEFPAVPLTPPGSTWEGIRKNGSSLGVGGFGVISLLKSFSLIGIKLKYAKTPVFHENRISEFYLVGLLLVNL